MGSNSLKDYLKRYESNIEEEKKNTKKKKQKKKKSQPQTTGILVVDEDPVWQKPVDLGEENDENSSEEEKPLVDEDIEVKRMRRLEQLRARRPYHAISEDGSGWVSLPTKHLNSNDLNNDMSPPRKRKIRNDTPSPEPELNPSTSNRGDADLSPPHQRLRRYDTPSPEHGSQPAHPKGKDSDLSPPNKRRTQSLTPEPKLNSSASNRVSADLSPPRQRSRHYDTLSPNNGSHPVYSKGKDSDISPPRKRMTQNSSLSPGPELTQSNSKFEDTDLSNSKFEDTDLSPPRQRSRHYDTPSPNNGSHPVYSKGKDSDISPPRKRRTQNSSLSPGPELTRSNSKFEDTDLSPPRQRPRELDLSPPRKRTNDIGRLDHTSTAKVVSRLSLAPDLSPPRKNPKEPSGPASVKNQKTGLISGRDIREETDKIKKDDWLRFKQMDPSISGRGAEPVYRDRIKGERISKEEYVKSKQKVEEKPKEKEIEWGKGLAQKREAEARVKELEIEKERPFARTRDDPDLDKMLKDRLRWGDPMAHLVKKKYPEPILPNLGESDRMKESGFVVPQDIPSHSWLKRGLSAAPNRYGIRPGRHWDGVDRSNGFEKEMFKRMNEKQSRDKEAYLWSVSDM